VDAPRFQLAYLAATLTVFWLVAWFTRANVRRITGAACAALVFTAMSAPIDNVARRAGWWTYPSCIAPAHPPLAVYIGQAFVFVGTTALVAWRVKRRFGARGVVALVIVVCVVGAIRDFSVAAAIPTMIRFGPFPASLIADLGAWLVVALVAIGVTRLVAGAANDSLRPV
jgi:hypothetical protein